jgi:hypothetical protein
MSITKGLVELDTACRGREEQRNVQLGMLMLMVRALHVAMEDAAEAGVRHQIRFVI